MGLARVQSCAVIGLDGSLVEVEVDVSKSGLPFMHQNGKYPSKEAPMDRDRAQTIVEKFEDAFQRLQMAHLSLVSIGPKPMPDDWNKLNTIEAELQEYQRSLERIRALWTISQEK